MIGGLPDREVAGVRFRYGRDRLGRRCGPRRHLVRRGHRRAHVPVLADPSTATRRPRSAPSSSKTSHWAFARKDPCPPQAPSSWTSSPKLSHRPARRRRPGRTGPGQQCRHRPHRPDRASIGPDDTIRGRLAGTVGTVIAPPAQTARRGRRPRGHGNGYGMDRADRCPPTRPASAANGAGNGYVVHPDEIGGLGKERPTSLTAATPKLRVRPPVEVANVGSKAAKPVGPPSPWRAGGSIHGKRPASRSRAWPGRHQAGHGSQVPGWWSRGGRSCRAPVHRRRGLTVPPRPFGGHHRGVPDELDFPLSLEAIVAGGRGGQEPGMA